MSTDYLPYTYLIGWTHLNLWYYGVRIQNQKGRRAHPGELWVRYFTSSKEVAKTRKAHGEPDVISIRRTFTNSQDAYRWEQKAIHRLKMPSKPQWLNRACYGYKDFSNDPTRTSGIVSSRRSNGRPWHDAASKKKIGQAHLGSKMNIDDSERRRRRSSLSNRNLHDEAFKQKNSAGRARRWNTPGEKEKQAAVMLDGCHTAEAKAKKLAALRTQQYRDNRRQISQDRWSSVGDAMYAGLRQYYLDPERKEQHRQMVVKRYQRQRGWDYIVVDGKKFDTISECAKYLGKGVEWVREQIKKNALATLKE